MINVKELIEDFLALGYKDEDAIKLARQEVERRQACLVQTQLEYSRKRNAKSRTDGNKFNLSLA